MEFIEYVGDSSLLAEDVNWLSHILLAYNATNATSYLVCFELGFWAFDLNILVSIEIALSELSSLSVSHTFLLTRETAADLFASFTREG